MKTNMKRLLALILALSMVMSLLSVSVWAADTSADGSGDPTVSSTEPQEAEPEEAAPEGEAAQPEAAEGDKSEGEEKAEEPPEDNKEAKTTEEAQPKTLKAAPKGIAPVLKMQGDEHTHDNITFSTAWDKTNSLPTDPGNYYLTQNVTLTGTWTPPDGETKLCLNGHTISANGGNYPVITVNKAEKIVAIYDENNEGKITGSNFNDNGGGISITAGHVTLHGGSIEGNRASNGGGVSVMGPNAQFSMSGGRIQYNEGYNNTGGVLLGSNGCFTMSGGTIQYNVGKNFGGIGTATTKMEFSGDIQIKDNYIFSDLSSSVRKITNTSGSYAVAEGGTPCDVKMSNGTDMISVVGALAETAKIGVFNTRTFTNSDNVSFNVAERFFSNDPNFNVAKGSNGQLRLVRGTLDSVSYREASWNETTRTVDYTDKTVANPIAVEEGTTSWSNGTYVVNSGVTVPNRITVSGTVNLILCDDCTLTAKKGIQVSEGNTLNIYAQSENSGSITATGPKAGRGAGIGGNDADGQRNAGHIVIHGGNITAKWEQDCNSAGIGGGQNGTGGTIDIYGGKITATGHGHYGAGIGGAGSGSSGIITIYGGNIVANGNSGGAGIGGGKDGKCDTITINGGVVIARGGQGGMNSAGIGGGHGKPGGTIIINGGDVLARGGHGRPGIGAGALPTTDIDQGALTIAPGMVVRTSTGVDKDKNLAIWPCLDYIEKREQWVHIWPHTHSDITYTVLSGDTLTGSCSNPDCNFVNGKINVKFVANDAAYDNKPHGVTLSCTDMCHGLEEFNLDTDASIKVKAQYQKKIGETYGTATETVPVDPGTYKASITLGQGDGAATAYAEYTITNPDYNITVQPAENGTVTADKTSAKFSDVTTLTITPAEGKELVSINATSGVLTQTAVDTLTGTLTYTLTGITADTTVTATFGELETYTVLYNATGNPAQVYCRVGSDSTGYKMTQNVKIGNLNCWAVPTQAAADSETLSVSFSTDGTTWGNTVNANVTDSVPTTLNAGQTVSVRGETNVFALVFASDDATIVSQYYLVTPDTTSITVTNPTKNGYTFGGWMYSTKSTAQDPEKDEVSHSQQIAAGDGSTVISVNGTFTETTILSALWKLDNCQVSYDLNGGTGSASSATVSYGNKATKPTDPTKSGYAFVRWVVAKNTTQRIGNDESTMLAGAAFDFANTSVINDLKLKAEWKHVHSYVCLPLDHSAFGGAFQEYVNAGYTQYLHIKICTSMDDYCAEAHSFDSNGKCACGYTKPEPKVKLTKIIDNGTPTTVTTTQNQVVSISAPQSSSGKKFARWEYSGDGENWNILSTNSYAAFAIPQDMYVRAVYEPEKVTVSVETFMDGDKLVYFFYYSVPDGWKVLDGGLLTGDNSNLRYMEVRYGGRATPYYMPRSDNAIASLGAATVGERIFREQPISGSGKPSPDYKRPSVLGKTACCAITYPRSLIANYKGNYYLYGMGFIVCQKPDGSKMGYKTNALWASKNSPKHLINDVWEAN